ncbi:MAG TPA: FAD-dependent oxidoreductase [Candidatus Binataceae bacterium]|nr:FAD-dependent oxidoreductase [Candidatus Binataceae bacterium]
MADATSIRGSYLSVVDRIVDHNHDTRSMFLRMRDGKFRFVPGQFISILIPLGDETRRRAYSIASIDSGVLEIVFNQVPNGRGVGWLFERAPGDAVEFMGPFGNFTLEAPPQMETILIAEGTAIAPILPMLHRAQQASHAPMLLLYAASDRAHLLYRDQLEALASRDANFHIETMIVDGDILVRLHDEVTRRWVAADTNRARQFYICGVGKGVIAIRDLLRGAGYERRSVHYEQW